MKKLLTPLLALMLGACTTTAGLKLPTLPPVNYNVRFVQGCTIWASAFSTALQMRQTGKLNDAQIAQVNILDNQLTPLCTAKTLPANPQVAVGQVTAALTTIGVLEGVHYVSPTGQFVLPSTTPAQTAPTAPAPTTRPAVPASATSSATAATK